jgi:predicted LPLAT superfamily acyltransferase
VPHQKKSVERKRGNRLGFWLFRVSVRMFGLRGAYGLLYFVALYYVLRDRAVVEASLAYVKRRFPGHGKLRHLFDVYRLFLSQGESLIDRYAVALGYGGIDIEIRGADKIRDILFEPAKGFIFLTAHVGNWQVAMTVLKRFKRTVYMMMRPEDNSAVKSALNIDDEEEHFKIIFTNDPLGGVIDAIKAIDQGNLVSIMGDRTYGYSAADVSFLGGDVQFPFGAFSIAAAVHCPVVVLLSAKVGLKKYLVDVSHIIPPPLGRRGKKEEVMKASVREFARILEEYVADYPFQWFVFRDIWKSNR